MPGTPKPVVDPRFGPHWSPVLQAIHFGQEQQNMANAGKAQGNTLDQYGNTVVLNGTSLDQVVTIGAGWLTQAQVEALGIATPAWMTGTDPKPSGPIAGVLVGTNLSGSGYAVQQNLATGSITTSTSTMTATIDYQESGTFAVGQTIGAADVSDPTLGTAVPAIKPGTTITAISGTGPYTVTLSAYPAESGTSLYCAACTFTQLT